MIRAIDVNGLIGNIGGYSGLLLGYSLLQIPEFITWVIFKFKRYFDTSANRDHSIDEQTKGNAVIFSKKHPF